MKWRSVLVLAAWAPGLLVPARTTLAQQAVPGGAPGGVDPACACFEQNPPGDGDGPGSDRKWLLAGAAGLALLSGIPFGGTTAQGLPFAAGLPAPEAPLLAEAPELPAAADVPAASPAVGERSPGVGGTGTPAALTPLPPVEERHGIIPPKTATHLPLLAAAGVLMVGAGALLSRRQSRERRRRRRFVAL